MFFRVFFAALIYCICVGTAGANFDRSRQSFEALDFKQRMLLQWDLTWIGDYRAVTDGDFGPYTYDAIRRFQTANDFSADGVLTSGQRAILRALADKVQQLVGLEFVKDPRSGLELGIPSAIASIKELAARGTRWKAPDGRFVLETTYMPYVDFSYSDLYRKLSDNNSRRSVDYKTLRREYFVIAGTYSGKSFYMKMHPAEEGTRGVTFAWDRDLLPRINATVLGLAATVFDLPKDSAKSDPNTSVPSPPSESEKPNRSKDPEISAGSGFFISPDGVMLTNAHVAGDCDLIVVRDYGSAKAIRVDPTNDLALLKLDKPATAPHAIFQERPLRIGADIAVAGFPLPERLGSSLNVTFGEVTSLSGTLGDTRYFQLSAPIQKGNSGGPVLDFTGRIVGVATARLNDLREFAESGAIPQNVNFALRGEVLSAFLRSAAVQFDTEASEVVLSKVDLAEQGRQFTAQVLCVNR